LWTPEAPWESLTMDFVTDLPELQGYTSILVVIDRFTKMAKYMPCRKEIDSKELARRFFEVIICSFGIPETIITDRGSTFASNFWKRVCSNMSTDHRLSTAFHPQTNGQTERQNQMMKQYLRAYINYEQDNWVELLPLVEFAYNNSIHFSTGFTPFFANYGYNPSMHFKRPKALKDLLPSQQSANEFAERLEDVH